jgi:uncharacterized protein YehS (DUF1456 family)
VINNETLKRVLNILDLSESKIIEIFESVDFELSQEQLGHWLKKDNEAGYQKCKDVEFSSFLNGLIIEKRGKKDGPLPFAEAKLTNNIVFRKLNIAFDLKADDVIKVLELANLRVSKNELTAFFRKPEHRNYRECKDQILRNFLTGLQLKHRGKSYDRNNG